MAKVKSPLLSLDASGKIADSLVFMKWKGINDVRQYVIPSNPRTADQQAQRGRLASAVALWHSIPFSDDDLAAWNLLASNYGSMSGFNVFVKLNIVAQLANKVWTALYDVRVSAITTSSFTVTVSCDADKGAKLYVGTSKTYMPTEVSGTYSSSNKTWTFEVDNLSPGVNYYFYIANKVETDAARTGIYKVKTASS